MLSFNHAHELFYCIHDMPTFFKYVHFVNSVLVYIAFADPERGRGGGSGPKPEKSQNIEFLSNIGPDPL